MASVLLKSMSSWTLGHKPLSFSFSLMLAKGKARMHSVPMANMVSSYTCGSLFWPSPPYSKLITPPPTTTTTTSKTDKQTL